MLIKLSTDKTVSEAAAAMQGAVQANHFGVMQVHNLKETMTKKGVAFALPCRISIYEEGGKTTLATLKPTTLLAMFNTLQLAGVAQEVEDTMVKIMKEAASG
ncbi:MAG: DUF302 domain-containing protein [Verrucomicrobia bacterium]|nr:DUF302 domain-containing protein [Verrucomicrobiota bacterium]